MTNPFEDENRLYRVLINDEDQHSLWPDWIDIPDGWRALFGPTGHAECLEYVEANWTDLRPRSLREQMDGAGTHG
jgi:MbtH protein